MREMTRGRGPQKNLSVPAVFFLLLTAAAAAVPPSSSTWSRGGFTVVSVASSPPAFSYSVAVNGSVWLSGGGAAATCNGVSRSTVNATLVASAPLAPCDGADARLGAFECVAQALAASDGDASCALVASVRYYAGRDAFEFHAAFGAGGGGGGGGGVAGTATAPLPNSGAGWPAGPWPLSTAFPAFSGAAPLGFQNTHGNLLSPNFAWAREDFLAAGYVGGLEGGPLLLFDASAAPSAQLHPPALVLSPLTHAKSVFVAPWAGAAPPPPPPPPPPASSIAGVYKEVDHGQMRPLACSTAVGADGIVTATFANGDPRRASCWATANCTLVAPSGTAACVNGIFWAPDGSPFATQNWTLDVAADFSSLNTSEGCMYPRQNPAHRP